MTGELAAQITRNQRTGRAWELACLRDLRASLGFPAAERHSDKRASDIVGVGDLGLECTTEQWDHIGGKLRQAADDAQRRGLADYVVWKQARTSRGLVPDPALGLVITHAHVWWRVWRRLEDLEQAEMRGEDAYRRGFEAGLRAAREQNPFASQAARDFVGLIDKEAR